jgi:hypothetical protein
MTSPRDLEIARLLGWYRIPLRSAPKVVDVDYLAFYQTSGFADSERGLIHHIAPVRGHELTTRGELLKDQSNHPRAGEEYYKVILGPVSQLNRPIHAEKWKRVTFLYTTGKMLQAAESLNDLVVQPGERAVLWQSIRERQQDAQCGGVDSAEMDLSEEDLARILGYLALGGS